METSPAAAQAVADAVGVSAMPPTQDGRLLTLSVTTLAGTELHVEGLSEWTPVNAVLWKLAAQVGSPVFMLRLLAGTEILKDTQTIGESGLTKGGASAVLICCPVEPQELYDKLMHAFDLRQRGEVRRLVDLGAGLDSDGKFLLSKRRHHMEHGPGCTVLHLAIRGHMEELARVVIGRGIGLENKNDSGRTALVQAMLLRKHSLVDALLDAGANADATDLQGRSALHHALQLGVDNHAARLLRMCSPDICSHAFASTPPLFKGKLMCVGSPMPPVLLACLLDMPQTVLALLDIKADVEGSDFQGRTALHYAHHWCRESTRPEARGVPSMWDVTFALLDRGASKDTVDNFGLVPLQGIHEPKTVEVFREKARGPPRGSWRCFPGK